MVARKDKGRLNVLELDIWRNLLAIAVVFALLGLVVYKFGRLPGAASVRQLRSLRLSQERLRLTPQHSIHLVGLGDKAWLLACHPNGTTLLTEVSPAASSAGPAAPPLARGMPA